MTTVVRVHLHDGTGHLFTEPASPDHAAAGLLVQDLPAALDRGSRP